MTKLSFSNVTLEEATGRARDLAPALRERVERGENARILLPETLADLHRSGVIRIWQPKRWGGMELDAVSCFDVGFELGRGCASTAWTAVNILSHHWMLALYDEKVQAEIWGSDPDVFIASGVVPAQGQARAVDGGYVINGRWNFSSGVTVSDWNMLATTVRDGDKVVDYKLCVVHKSDYEIVDDWRVLGMRSTGSMTVTAKDLFVPEHRALSMHHTNGGGGFPGASGNPGPLYRVALTMISGHVIASALVGNAQAALELTIEALRKRGGFSESVQVRVAAAGAKIDASRHLLRADLVEAQGYADRDEIPDQETKLRAKRNAAYAVAACTEAVDSLYVLAGAHGLYDGSAMQRIFRDAHAGAAHVQLREDPNLSNWGLVALGGEMANTLL